RLAEDAERRKEANGPHPAGDDAAEPATGERGIGEDVAMAALPGKLRIVVDRVEVLGPRDLRHHARHGQLEGKALELLTRPHLAPAEPRRHARLVPAAISSGVRWTRIWLVRRAARSSRSLAMPLSRR